MNPPITLILLVALSQPATTLNQNKPDVAVKPGRPGLTQVVTGQITGTVTDEAGAAVAGVEVMLRSPDGNTRFTTTDSEGRYRFVAVPPGSSYSLRFTKPASRVIEQPNVTVGIANTTTVNMQFQTGPVPRPTPSPNPSPLPSPTLNPTPVGTPSPTGTEWERKIEDARKSLHESKVVFAPPAEMQEQKTETIEARISFRDIGDDLAKGIKGGGPVQQQNLQVSEIMTVTLTGDRNAFLIQELSEARQVVAGKPFAQWVWRVTPLQSGDQKLTLTATATIFLGERGEQPVDFKTLEKSIAVRVDRWRASKQFIANNWQWLWTVIVIPSGGLLWGLRRRRQAKRQAGFR